MSSSSPPHSHWDPAVEVVNLTMKFGDFTALEGVSLRIRAHRVHALLGENGAGKSTLVKCLIGYQKPTSGQISIQDREVELNSPKEAHEKGVGMVFQHFNLVENMSVAENFILSQDSIDLVLDWKKEKTRLMDFLSTAPFTVPLDSLVRNLSAGEKQKLEILKQLYFQRPILILDEPTSVLTPQEADEILGLLKAMVDRGELTLILITHKFREVELYADDVTVLRRGKLMASGHSADYTREQLGTLMVGQTPPPPVTLTPYTGVPETVFEAQGLSGPGVVDCTLEVNRGEIVGLAGVSGNGQRELVEMLTGLKPYQARKLTVGGQTYQNTRDYYQKQRIRILPEMPLQNACVPSMSVTENLAFRAFDRPPLSQGPFVSRKEMVSRATQLQTQYQIRGRSLEAPISTLSGGNVQRAVLARELSEDADFLVAVNPCFGLDFGATAEIHSRLEQARSQGTAILLISEDLDELLEMSDRIAVIFEGRIVAQVTRDQADPRVLGQYMAGGSNHGPL